MAPFKGYPFGDLQPQRAKAKQLRVSKGFFPTLRPYFLPTRMLMAVRSGGRESFSGYAYYCTGTSKHQY